MTLIFRMAQAAYRAVTPTAFRRQLSCLRNIAYLSLTRGDPEAIQYHKMIFWSGLGWHVLQRRLPSGLVMWVDVRDERGIGRSVYLKGEFEPEETNFFARYLRPGMAVVDIGANIGTHTVAAAKAVGPDGLVLAFEPDPHNFQLLRRNVTANRLNQVHVFNCALGEREATLTLYRSPHNFGDHRLYADQSDRQGIPVPVRRLDDVLAAYPGRTIDLLKIDVQGYEAQVFAGMARRLSESAPRAIMMEYWPHGIHEAGGDPVGLLDQLASVGYQFHRLDPDGHLERVPRADIDRLIPPFDADRPDASYVNLVLLS